MDRAKAFVTLLLACLAFPGQGQATTLNELKVGVRVLDFLTAPLRGQVPIAVIYDGSSKASADDALAIQGWLNSGVSSAKAHLVPSLLDGRQLGPALPFQVVLVASGSAGYFDRIFNLALKSHALVISSDLQCAYEGKCAVGVSSTPRVEVIVNRAVATSCEVEFTEAFRMMVREY